MYTPMSRAWAAKLVMKSSVGGEPAMAARIVPPCAGHLSIPAAKASLVSIGTSRNVAISTRRMHFLLGSVAQAPANAGRHDVFLPVTQPDGIECQPAFVHAPLVEMDRRHAVAELTRDLRGAAGRRENHLHHRHAPGRLAWDQHRLDACDAGQRGRETHAAL